jgi:hypothetical protein
MSSYMLLAAAASGSSQAHRTLPVVACHVTHMQVHMSRERLCATVAHVCAYTHSSCVTPNDVE